VLRKSQSNRIAAGDAPGSLTRNHCPKAKRRPKAPSNNQQQIVFSS
jgi:hypothetical protein